jgi:hypothetical protein
VSFPATSPVVQIYAGDTYTQRYIFKDSAGDPIDLVAEGWDEWKAQYRATRPAVDFYDFTVDDTDADEGVIVVSMSKETTKKLTHNGVWDLQASKGAELKTWVTSDVQVEMDVTRV